MLYETLSLIFQTAVFLYFLIFVWRSHPALPHALAGTGMLMLVARQTIEVWEHARDRMMSNPYDVIECAAFASLLIGLYLHHTREIASRDAVAARLRKVVEGRT